jgi:hypothetical protein
MNNSPSPHIGTLNEKPLHYESSSVPPLTGRTMYLFRVKQLFITRFILEKRIMYAFYKPLPLLYCRE